MMKSLALAFATLFFAFDASANLVVYQGTPTAATGSFEQLESSEFVIREHGTGAKATTRLCGLWKFKNGAKSKFDYKYKEVGNEIIVNGAVVGSRSNTGFEFRVEQNLIRMDWNNYYAIFNFGFEHPQLGGYVLAGRYMPKVSKDLARACEP